MVEQFIEAFRILLCFAAGCLTVKLYRMRHSKAFWRGFYSVFLYAGAFICLAPLWSKDWDGPMKRLLSNREI